MVDRTTLYGVRWPGWLFFCGRAWPVYTPAEGGEWPTSPPVDASGSALLDQIVARYEALPRENPARPWAEAFFGRDPAWTRSRNGLTTESRLRAFEAELGGVPFGEDILVGLGAPYALAIPIFAAHRRSELKEVLITTNPPLIDLGFHRILDPYACFQAIETFLGNQLAPPDLAPDRVGSDEILARQKGFDEMSFRTAAPGTKKENRARNRARKKGL